MADFEMTETEVREKCTKALDNPIPDRDELNETLCLATEYGFPEVVKKILARGHTDLLEECRGKTRSGCTGGITCDGVQETQGMERLAVNSVVNKKRWLQERTNYFNKPWSEVEEENQPGMALNKFNALMEVVDKLKPSEALEAMKCGRRMIQHLIEDLSSETHEESESRTARIKFLQIILDKTYIGENHVDATILVDEYSRGEHTDSIDTKQAIYQAIAESKIEELKCHPCFAAVVDKKWQSGYHQHLHNVLFLIFILFLVSLTTALVLAARSSDPRDYHGAAGGAQGLCEVLTFLYLLLTATFFTMRHIYRWRKAIHKSNRCHAHRLKYVSYREWKHVTFKLDDVLKVCGRLSILLIVPLRAAGSQWQWLFASLAIICNGHRVFYYISVFSCTGRYVGTLSIVVKRDLPWIVVVFLVLNFSLGGGLYFAFVGESANPADINSTNEIYTFWESGFRIVSGGEASEPDGWFPVLVYLVFAFTISVVFGSIVVAQFTTTYAECTTQAKVLVVLSKNEIMLKMEDTIGCFQCCVSNEIMQKIVKIMHSCQRRTKQWALLQRGAERDSSCHGYTYLKMPYSSGEVDFRPATVQMMHEMRQEIISQMEHKFEGLRKLMKKN